MESSRKLINEFGCEAVTACQDLMSRYNARKMALNGPKAVAHQFEDEVATQFAINPNCKGATLTRYRGPQEKASPETNDALMEAYWTLIVDYNVGATTQSWTLVPNKGASHQAEGDSAAKIAADVCAIVMGHGGTVAR